MYVMYIYRRRIFWGSVRGGGFACKVQQQVFIFVLILRYMCPHTTVYYSFRGGGLRLQSPAAGPCMCTSKASKLSTCKRGPGGCCVWSL